jgi:acyl-CoA synthetase (AMP-forming)/AMP-acid ligase II
MLLDDLLAESAARHPDRVAARFPGRPAITYAELAAKRSAVASVFAARGVAPGDRIGILYENELPALLAFWGAQRLGAEVVDIPHLSAKPTIEAILAEARPKLLAADARLIEKQQLTDLPLVAGTDAILGANGPEELGRPARSEDDVALVIYTSGSTGMPKGVMLSHRNLISNISAANAWVGLTHEDSILVVVPLSFIHGRMQLLTHALIGGTVCFSAGFHFPKKVVDEIREHRVTGFSGVPYHYKRLIEPFGETDLPDLRYVLVTGGALSADEIDALGRALPRAGIHLAYGQTEASPRITYIGPAHVHAKRGSCGRALPGTVVEVIGDDGEPLPAGAIGEVVAGGPHIMRGYVSGDERSSGRIDDRGRLRTGDLGRFDDEGFLYLVGRSSQMIKSSGERIFPKEIEDVLARHPSVAEACVLGVPDRELGERIVACVALKDGAALSLAELRRHCLEAMSFVRVPRALELFGALPKTSSGKVDRPAVEKLLADRMAR